MSKPIRILHVLQRMEAGGTQALLMNLYRNIDRTKVQFDFFVEYDYKEFYDAEIESLGGHVYYSNVRRDFNIIKFQKKLKEVIKNNDYKIVHVHTYSIGYFALQVAKKCGVPVRIAHSHNNETVRDSKYVLKKIMQKIYTIYATDLFACSKSAGEYLFGKKEFYILNNSIDSEKFIFNETFRKEIRKELNLENSFVIGHVGRLHAQKNHKFLINVFKKIQQKKKNAKMILVGNGPLEEEIKNQISKLKLEDKILLLGVRKDINKILMGIDVFALPSLFEGLGIVAIEAQAAGTPVVASDTLPKETEISSLIKKLSLNESEEIWADTIIQMSDNKEKQSNMSQKIIDSNFDIKDSAKKLENKYIDWYKKNLKWYQIGGLNEKCNKWR